MLYYSTHKRFNLFYRIPGIVTVCHFVRNLMAFVCQEIKALLTYLLTYLYYDSTLADDRPSSNNTFPFQSKIYHQRAGYTETLLCSSDLDLDPMTLLYELDLKIPKMYLHIKNFLDIES